MSFTLTFVSLLLMGHTALADVCKCSSLDPCWPSASEWNDFNETISGRLIRTIPPASVCYPSEPNYDEQACNTVLSKWTTSVFHSSDPASVPSAWSNNSCNPIYPNGTSVAGDPDAGKKGCSLGALPPFVVNATEATHVNETLQFAKKRNLRISIKNTGHNGSGRNLGFSSLSIWTHNMKQAVFHQVFQPTSCSANMTWKGSQMAITIGAGIQDGEIYDFAKKNNVVAVGGTNADVGVVGWATGGGHGYLTGEYGMGADNILEASIVTPNGELIIANACQNEDIFWAIRGGGGGTFGVIINMTLKAYPIPKMTFMGFDIAANNGTSTKSWWKFVAQLHGLLPALQDQGVKGYYTMGGPPSSQTIGVAGSLFLWDANNGTADKAVAPIRQLLSANNDTVTGSVSTMPVSNIYDLIGSVSAIENVGKSTAITAARLITRKVVMEDQEELARVLEEIGPLAVEPTDGVSNPSISGTMTISHEPIDNSLNPAWRDSVVHLIVSQSWKDSLPQSKVSEAVNNMTYKKLNALQRLDLSSGTYLNEANSLEPGWQWSFFGTNYGRLREIKGKIDPEGLLWCPQCVGSEDWIQQEDGKLCHNYQPFSL